MAKYQRSEIRLHLLFFAMAAIVLLMSVLMTSQGNREVIYLDSVRRCLIRA